MLRVLKTLLLWLIMVALPLQGVAAVVKSSCGPRHHGLAETVSSGVDHHHDSFLHHHDGDDGTAVAQKAPDTSAKTGAPSVKSSYCSACAACCFGATAPPTVSLWSPADIRPVTILLAPDSWVAGFIPAGLERPPKPLSA